MWPCSLSAVKYSVNFLLETTVENTVGLHQNHASEALLFTFVGSMRFCTAVMKT